MLLVVLVLERVVWGRQQQKKWQKRQQQRQQQQLQRQAQGSGSSGHSRKRSPECSKGWFLSQSVLADECGIKPS